MLRTLCLLGLMMGSTTASATGFRVLVDGARETRLGLPQPIASDANTDAAGSLWKTLQGDLEASGTFVLIDPTGYLDPSPGVEPGTFAFNDWTLLKTNVLVKSRLLNSAEEGCTAPSNSVCLDLFVYWVNGGETLARKRLVGRLADRNALAHTAANEVLLAVTGHGGPFGHRLAAVNKATGNKEIVLVDSDGTNTAKVTNNGAINLTPAWSPNGRSIAWTSYKRGNPDLYIKNLVSGQTRVVSNQYGLNTSPAFSPDGSTLAMVRSHGADSDIYLVDANTGAVKTRVTRGGGIDVSPHFSPDGNRLVFASERSGGSHIFEYSLSTQKTRRVTFNGQFNTDPVYHPDGERIAFVSRVDGRFDILTCDLQGKGLVRVTQGTGNNEDPSWSPDGRYLVFSSTRSGSSQLWMATANGRHQTPLTTTGEWSQPTFAPLN